MCLIPQDLFLIKFLRADKVLLLLNEQLIDDAFNLFIILLLSLFLVLLIVFRELIQLLHEFVESIYFGVNDAYKQEHQSEKNLFCFEREDSKVENDT